MEIKQGRKSNHVILWGFIIFLSAILLFLIIFTILILSAKFDLSFLYGQGQPIIPSQTLETYTTVTTSLQEVKVMPSTWTPVPTNPQTPTYTRAPTLTITPTIRITIKTNAPIKYPTETPYIIVIPNNPPPCPSSYEKEYHKTYLKYLHDSYQSDVDYYNELLYEAALNGDAMLYWQIQQEMKRAEQDYNEQVKQENKRYSNLCK